MFLSMLKDDFPEVRLHIISKLELVHQGTCRNALCVCVCVCGVVMTL